MSVYFKHDAKAARAQERDWKALTRVIVLDLGRCVYCGVIMNNIIHDPHQATEDHITPQCKGGRITVRCCYACNGDKDRLSLNEWRAALCVRHRRLHLFYYERLALRHFAWHTIFAFCS